MIARQMPAPERAKPHMLGVAHVLGSLLAIFGAHVRRCRSLTSLITRRRPVRSRYIIAAAISSGVGLLDLRSPRAAIARELKPRDGFLLATLSWVLMSAVRHHSAADGDSGAVVHRCVLRGDVGPHHHRARRCSPGSTTCRRRINLWRHALHWFGGLGIIVLAVAMLPLLGVGGMQLYKAETPGPGEGREAHAAHHRDREVALGRVHWAHRRRHRRAARRAA